MNRFVTLPTHVPSIKSIKIYKNSVHFILFVGIYFTKKPAKVIQTCFTKISHVIRPTGVNASNDIFKSIVYSFQEQINHEQ